MATIGTRLFTWLKGEAVGQDEFGNCYYRERKAVGDRRARRWVIYKGLAEPSKVPAHWHRWLHYTTDDIPIWVLSHRYPWQKQHIPNLTGTPNAYVPPGHILRGARRDPSTSDYEAWQPK